MKRSVGVLCLSFTLCSLSSMAKAIDLTVVEVASPAVLCVFDPDCKVTVTDTVDTVTIPGATGTARIQSRTFPGQFLLNPLVAKRFGYEYRVDMTQATTLSDASCITALTVVFGSVTKLQYNKAGPLDDVFVVTKGGIGTIGLTSAVRTRNSITFTFSQPVCAADTSSKGQSSFFFGLASSDPPQGVLARIEVPGLDPINVKARAPNN